MTVLVPHADTVDGDLIEAAKPMLLLGWAAPAALTARVAIERGLLDLCDTFGVSVPQRPHPGLLCDLLYDKRRRPLAPDLQRSVRLYGKLSGIAHGADVKLAEAVELVTRVDEVLADWRSCQPAE